MTNFERIIAEIGVQDFACKWFIENDYPWANGKGICECCEKGGGKDVGCTEECCYFMDKEWLTEALMSDSKEFNFKTFLERKMRGVETK